MQDECIHIKINPFGWHYLLSSQRTWQINTEQRALYYASNSEKEKPYNLNVSFPLRIRDSARQKVTVLVLFAASHKSLGVAKQIVRSGDRTDATCSSFAAP